MTESFRQFMSGIIDYAGLFPPAKLPLHKALRNYAKYRGEDNAWMLSRFILPVSKFHETGRFSEELFTPEKSFSFSVLGGKAESIDEFKEEIATVITNCIDFCETHRGFVKTDMLEMKLPAEAAFSQDPQRLKKLMDDTAEKLKASAETPAQIFYEGKFGDNWQGDNEAIIKALSAHNKQYSKSDNYQFAAYKIRCGGITADLFPSIDQVAFILNTARKNDVALKGTAGLHHPVRHYADEVQTKMHGFLNVFGGGMLACANDFDDATLQEVLNEEDPKAFSFTDTEFSWKNYSVTTDEIERLRREALLSYGSCSFDEPREDLRGLGLL